MFLASCAVVKQLNHMWPQCFARLWLCPFYDQCAGQNKCKNAGYAMLAHLKLLRLDTVGVSLPKRDACRLQDVWRSLPGLVQKLLGQLLQLWDPLADISAPMILQCRMFVYATTPIDCSHHPCCKDVYLGSETRQSPCRVNNMKLLNSEENESPTDS